MPKLKKKLAAENDALDVDAPSSKREEEWRAVLEGFDPEMQALVRRISETAAPLFVTHEVFDGNVSHYVEKGAYSKNFANLGRTKPLPENFPDFPVADVRVHPSQRGSSRQWKIKGATRLGRTRGPFSLPEENLPGAPTRETDYNKNSRREQADRGIALAGFY
jgi:hypothetical protein